MRQLYSIFMKNVLEFMMASEELGMELSLGLVLDGEDGGVLDVDAMAQRNKSSTQTGFVFIDSEGGGSFPGKE